MKKLAARIAGVAGNGPLGIAVVVVAVLAVLASGAAGWYGVSWYRAAHDESLELAMTRDTVLRQARQAAINLTTLDHRNVQAGLDSWEQVSTGPLLEEFRTNRGNYVKTIQQGKVKTESEVVDGAVAELDTRAGTARVLMGIDVTVTPAEGDPTVSRQRLEMVMQRTGDGWKVSAVAPVGPASGAPAAGSPPPDGASPSPPPSEGATAPPN
ncbi:MAG: hypothetical protein GEV09_07140 [Pseudonocardiaceae bacterium]|nr:hypothetical protein [Pseudonocardiaceae bacterium]